MLGIEAFCKARYNTLKGCTKKGFKFVYALNGVINNCPSFSTAHLANMVELEEEYALKCGNILNGFDDIREGSKNLASCVKNIVKEHNKQSLSKKFPLKLFDKRTGILLNATIGSNRLD